MPFIGPILGAGQIHGNSALRGNNFILDFQDAITETGFELQFFSSTDELIGLIGTAYEKSNMVNLSMKTRKIKDLESFKFTIGRAVDIPFFDGMEVRFFYNGIKWFTGILNVNPDQQSRNISYEYTGKGYSDLFKRITVSEVYSNKTLTEIVIDLIETYLADTKIIYEVGKIDLPNYTVSQKEWKNKKLEKAFNDILDIANVDYNNAQYRYGVDKDRKIFFELISNNIQYGFFEGKQFQNPKLETNNDDIINTINYYSAGPDNQQVALLGSTSDSDSIARRGERSKNITVSDDIDGTTLKRIADRIIEQHKEPLIKAEINSLNIEDTPYPFGYYLINTRRTDYITNISDFEAVGGWDITNAPNATITASEENVLTLAKAFKIILNNSYNEYIEFALDNEFYFPKNVILYVSTESAGDFFKIRIFDNEGNSEDLAIEELRITNENDLRVTEAGEQRITEFSSFRIDIVGRYLKIVFPVTSLNNIKRVRIIFTSGQDFTFYIDRLDFEHETWKQVRLLADEFEYIVENANNKVKAVFNQEVDNIVDKIKELNEKTENIINIFEKS